MKLVAKFFSMLRKIKGRFVLIFLGLLVAGLMVFSYFVFYFARGHRNDERDNFLKLSSVDLASDFDYYFDFMEKNSPAFGAALRLHPNLREKAKKCREKILNSKSNFDQLFLIDKFSSRFFPGHNGILSCDLNDFVNAQFAFGFDKLFKVFSSLILDDNLQLFFDWNQHSDLNVVKENIDRLALQGKRDFAKIFADPQIFENTKKYAEFLVSKRGGVSFKKNDYEHFNTMDGVSKVELEVLKPDKIAYMKIPSFEVINDSEKRRFREFYKKISNYENLIIDLRNNPGGYGGYVHYLLPVFKKSFDVKNIGLFKLGPHFEKWKTELEDPFSSILCLRLDKEKFSKLKPVSELPEMPAFNFLDVEHATHFWNVGKQFSFVRKKETDLDFHGKVYLLVNGATASAATLFTQMALSSKEITIIGTPTSDISFGGWNVFVLPKSKLVVRYETCNTLNEDGSSQLMFGIKPNVLYRDNWRKDVLEWLVEKLESPGGFDVNDADGANGVGDKKGAVDMIYEQFEEEEKARA